MTMVLAVSDANLVKGLLIAVALVLIVRHLPLILGVMAVAFVASTLFPEDSVAREMAGLTGTLLSALLPLGLIWLGIRLMLQKCLGRHRCCRCDR